MGKKTVPQNEPKTLGPELTGLACIFLAAFLFVSVFSFHPGDPTFNQSINPWKVNNLAGSVGSYAAGLLVELFGLGAVPWPLFFLYLGLSRFIRRIRMNGRQWAGLTLLYLLLVIWAQHPWFAPEPEATYDILGGGMLGRALNGLVLPYLKRAGSFLLWLFLSFVGAHLLLGFSWRDLGKRFCLWCETVMENLREERRRRRAMVSFKEAQKPKKKEEPDFPQPPPRLDEDLILKPFSEDPVVAPAASPTRSAKPVKPRKGKQRFCLRLSCSLRRMRLRSRNHRRIWQPRPNGWWTAWPISECKVKSRRWHPVPW